MKTRRGVVLYLTIAVLLIFTACQTSEPVPSAEGDWLLTGWIVEGQEVHAEDIGDGESTTALIIRNDGMCTLAENSKTYEGSWKANGTTISLTVDGVDLTGTLTEDGTRLELNNGMVFRRD